MLFEIIFYAIIVLGFIGWFYSMYLMGKALEWSVACTKAVIAFSISIGFPLFLYYLGRQWQD
jgi:hypothetical protein